MSETFPSSVPLNSLECQIAIWRMFRDAADEDYLIARFSARSNLVYQFWWNAQQTIEKYLKSILLLNGYPTNEYGHSLVAMFDIALKISGDLLPVISCPPRAFRTRDQHSNGSRGFRVTREFVQEIEDNGNPNNRYRMFSTDVTGHTLVIFDEISFMLRRVAYPLDYMLQEHDETARCFLSKNRGLQLHKQMSFEKGLSAKHDKVWVEHFRWCNFAFFEDDAITQAELPRWGGSINAAPFLALDRPTPESLLAMEWIATASFPKAYRKEVLQIIQKHQFTKVAPRPALKERVGTK